MGCNVYDWINLAIYYIHMHMHSYHNVFIHSFINSNVHKKMHNKNTMQNRLIALFHIQEKSSVKKKPKIRQLKGNFLKFEELTRHYKPLQMEFKTLPTINTGIFQAFNVS